MHLLLYDKAAMQWQATVPRQFLTAVGYRMPRLKFLQKEPILFHTVYQKARLHEMQIPQYQRE